MSIDVDSPPGLFRLAIEDREGDYTLQTSDENKILRYAAPGVEGEGEEESEVTWIVTIPKDSEVDFAPGARLGIMLFDEEEPFKGRVRIEPAGGVSLYAAPLTEEAQDKVEEWGANASLTWAFIGKLDDNLWSVEHTQGFA